MSEHKHHIIPLKTYMAVFFTLLAMTVFTVFSAQFDLGWFTIILALLIASFKSSLVLLFFMHLYYDNKINLILILSSVLFLALFIGLTMIDVNRRQDLYDIKGKLVKPQVEYKSNNHSSDH